MCNDFGNRKFQRKIIHSRPFSSFSCILNSKKIYIILLDGFENPRKVKETAFLIFKVPFTLVLRFNKICHFVCIFTIVFIPPDVVGNYVLEAREQFNIEDFTHMTNMSWSTKWHRGR